MYLHRRAQNHYNLQVNTEITFTYICIVWDKNHRYHNWWQIKRDNVKHTCEVRSKIANQKPFNLSKAPSRSTWNGCQRMAPSEMVKTYGTGHGCTLTLLKIHFCSILPFTLAIYPICLARVIWNNISHTPRCQTKYPSLQFKNRENGIFANMKAVL